MLQLASNVRSRGRAGMRLTLTASLAMLFALLAAPVPPVAAHARLVESNPPSGSALATLPSEMVLRFSEAIDPSFSAASLRDAAGIEWPVGALATVDNDLDLMIPIPDAATMPSGTYTLVWRVLSAVDGHVTTGVISVSAGTGVAPTIGSTAESRPPWWRVAITWMWLAGLAGLTGAVAFTTFVAPGTSLLRDRAGRWTLLGAVALALAGSILAGYDLGPSALDSPLFSPPDAGTYVDLIASSTGGRWWLVSAFATLIAAALALAGKRSAIFNGVAAITLAVALLGFSASGHAAATSPAWLGITIDWVHVAAVAVWAGCLPYLWFELRRGSEIAGAAIDRFSRLALAAVALIVVTGVLRSAAHVAGPRNLVADDYGVSLIAKHLLFLPMLISAGVNRLVVIPRLRAADAAGEHAANDEYRRSAARFVGIEVACAVFVFGAAAILTQVAPADGPLPVDVAASTVTIDQRAAAGDVDVWLLAKLAGESSDRYSITLDPREAASPELQRVIVETSAMLGDTPIGDRFDADPLVGSDGTFVFPAIRLGLRGSWEITVVVRRAGVEDVSATFAIDTTAAGQPAPRLVDDTWSWPRITIPAWSLAGLSLFVFAGGLFALKRLRELQPFAAGILLTMTVLIAGGFAVQAYRFTTPVTASTELVNPTLADDASIARGEALWAQECILCHGPEGEGVETDDPEHGHGSAADLSDRRSSDQRDGDLFHWISNGVPGTDMPAFDEALTESERWDLVNYLRSLQR